MENNIKLESVISLYEGMKRNEFREELISHVLKLAREGFDPKERPEVFADEFIILMSENGYER